MLCKRRKKSYGTNMTLLYIVGNTFHLNCGLGKLSILSHIGNTVCTLFCKQLSLNCGMFYTKQVFTAFVLTKMDNIIVILYSTLIYSTVLYIAVIHFIWIMVWIIILVQKLNMDTALSTGFELWPCFNHNI